VAPAFGDDLDYGKKITSSRKAIANAASSLAQELKLQGIMVPTNSGYTAAVLSANRPPSPLLGITWDSSTCRKLALHWGVIPLFIEKEKANNWQILSQEIGKSCKLTRTGNKVLLVSGFNDDELLNEPVLKIIILKK